VTGTRTATRTATRTGVLIVALCGCATVGGSRGGTGGDGIAAWQALVDGRRAEGERLVEGRLAVAPRDPLALFAWATAAFERGDGGSALEGYALVIAAAREAPGDAWGALLAPVAAARVLGLYDDVSRDATRRVEDLLLGPGARGDGALPWQARVELARLADHAGRRTGDVAALARTTEAAGCARAVVDAGSLGLLPHLDLERPSTPSLARP